MLEYLNTCFVRPSGESPTSFFGFAQFLTALALIAVVFTISDVRYRFRVTVAPFALIPVSYWCTAAIGLLILMSDVWFSEKWPIPVFLSNQILWQGILGLLFLFLVLAWMFFAFLSPAKFTSMNSKQYVRELYRIIVRGDDAELPTIANELGRSIINIVDLALYPGNLDIARSRRVKSARYAHDLLLLIGNRKFCRYVISNAPGTAIMLFQRISKTHKYYLPLRQFTTNIVTEALSNTDSILYHEDEGYHSGLLGYVKPFSAALFGDYRLIEGLSHNFGSPFDINYKAMSTWSATQLQTYCQAVQITFKNYLEIGAWREHSFALSRAFENIESSLADVYKLNDPHTPYFPNDIFSRLDAAVNFIRDAVEAIGKLDALPAAIKRRRRSYAADGLRDMYDEITDLMFDLVLAASQVTSEQARVWTVQYNTVWTSFFRPFGGSKAWPIVQFKLRRLIFDEITHAEFLNYQSARVLGLCLNVVGFKYGVGQSSAERALQTVIIAWTKRNFVRCWNYNAEVAASGLPAGLSYDAAGHRLVKTYAKGLDRAAPRDYLELDVPGTQRRS